MQVLAYLALGAGHDRATVELGEAPESMRRALACDQVELDEAIDALALEHLVVHQVEIDDDGVAITAG